MPYKSIGYECCSKVPMLNLSLNINDLQSPMSIFHCSCARHQFRILLFKVRLRWLAIYVPNTFIFVNFIGKLRASVLMYFDGRLISKIELVYDGRPFEETNMVVLDFFSTSAVNKKIIKKSLSEGQLFLYFFSVMLFDTLNYSLSWLSIAGQNLQTVDLVSIWGNFIFTLFGLIFLFYMNGGKNGEDFIAKFFSFSITVGIKYFIAETIIGWMPSLIPAIKIPYYDLISWWVLDLAMLFNIGYRIRKCTYSLN